MATLDLPGLTLRYELSGNPAGEVLVFSTSLGAHLEMWDPQAEALASRFHILRYDMRGHGRSSVPPGPYSIDQLGADLLALLDALGLATVSFCGLSIGGVLGQWLALNAPQRVRKIILANTAAKIGTAQTWDDRIDIIQRDGLAAMAASSPERWFTPGFRGTGAPIIAHMQQMVLADDPAGYIATCCALREADFRSRLGEIRTPTLILAGEYDPVTTVADAELLHVGIAGSQLRVLPAAHISNAELPETFNQAIVDFLETS